MTRYATAAPKISVMFPGVRTDDGDVLTQTRDLRLFLDNALAGRIPTRVDPVFGVQRLDDEVWRTTPFVRRFGRAAVNAATAATLPAGCCRWGLAAVHARELGEPAPEDVSDPPLRALLGEPCAGCLSCMWDRLTTRVHAGLSPKTRAAAERLAARRGLVASVNAAKPNFHPFGCLTCVEYRALVRDALTAGLDPAPLPPHRARPAPTGFVATVSARDRDAAIRGGGVKPVFGHDIEGVICNCEPCRAKRSRDMRAHMARGRAE